MTLTPETIAQGRALLEKATPGPWQFRDDMTTEGFVTIIANVEGEYDESGGQHYTYDVVCRCEDEYGERLPEVAANVRLIIFARNHLSDLLTAAEEAAALREAVRQIADYWNEEQAGMEMLGVVQNRARKALEGDVK